MPDEVPLPVLVVSDGTGETGQRVVGAGLRQFEGRRVATRVFGHVVRAAQLDDVFELAGRTGALVVSTLAPLEMRQRADRLSREHKVRYVDILGPLLGQFEGLFDREATGVPGLLHRADDRYFRRIDAIEFTVAADDGKDPRRLSKADVILVGVSRTGKTPLSTYLAHKGFKVGNQPIVLDQAPPEGLLAVDPGRVFALTIDAAVLQRIRRTRLRALRMSETTNYSDMGYILDELDYADRLFRQNAWPVIDVTNKAIEETAATVVRILRENGLLDPDDERARY